jgi:hypothetical protein
MSSPFFGLPMTEIRHRGQPLPPSSNLGLGIFPFVFRPVESATKPQHPLLSTQKCAARFLVSSAFALRSNVPSSRRTPRDENHVLHSCNLTTIPCGVFLLTPKSARGRMRAIKFAVPARSPVRGLSCGSSGQAFSFGGPRRAVGPPGAPPIPPCGCSSASVAGLARLCGL